MRMTDQQVNLKLVEEVEKHPVLYNFRLPGYTKKDETEKSWNEVGKEVHLSAADCKEKWKNLRAVFVRNMKPAKNAAGVKAKKAYYLLDAMQFTVPYIKALGTPSGSLLKPPNQEEGQQFQEFEYENNAIEEPETPSSSQQPPLTMSPPAGPSRTRPPLNSTPATQMSQNHYQSSNITQNKRALRNNAVDQAMIEYLQSKKAKNSSSVYANQDPRAEGLKMFLLSMLPDLLKMSDEQVRQFKRKTLDVVDDILSTRHRPFSSSSRTTPSSHSEILLPPEVKHEREVTDETPLLTTFEVRGVSTGTGSEMVTRGVEGFYDAVNETLN